jgi:phage shock protein PspC (stress-responsive transcriptional regulator)
MELTEKQELYIVRYVKAVSDALAGRLTEPQCERALARLQARIRTQINGLNKARPDDTDVLEIVRKLGSAENQADVLVRVWGSGESVPAVTDADTPDTVPAANIVPTEKKTAPPQATTKPTFSTPAAAKTPAPAVWLGVVAWCATQWDLPVWALRALTVLIGTITLPVALLLYTGAFFWLRLTGKPVSNAPLHPARMIFRPLLTGLLLAVIHYCGVYAIKGVYIVHDTWLKRGLPDMSEWAWFETEAGRMFFWMLFLLLPLSLFSAMPLANAWDYSLKRLNQACVALYAIVVSFGIASFVTGLILAFVREFTGR